MLNLSLKNKQAIVCGSTQGIGLAIAKSFAEQGARVCLLARNSEILERACSSLNSINGLENTYLKADFNDPEGLKLKLDQHLLNIGNVNILVNNTGGPPGGSLVDSKLEAFFDAYKMHLACNHILMQAVVDGMRSDSYGRIINIISTSVKVPLKGLGVSNTTRGAVASWAKTLANELGSSGITVNNVLPGATKTARLEGIIQSKSKKTGHSEDVISSSMLSEIPLGRFGEAEEIASLVGFLASPSAAYISGTSIPVDGGRTGAL
jgi:3-oxoacyl-[acyl-carrier protein] reductase